MRPKGESDCHLYSLMPLGDRTFSETGQRVFSSPCTAWSNCSGVCNGLAR